MELFLSRETACTSSSFSMSWMCRLIVLCSPVRSVITFSGTINPDGFPGLDCLLDSRVDGRSYSVKHLADWCGLAFFTELRVEPATCAKRPFGFAGWGFITEKTVSAKRSSAGEESGTVDIRRRRAIHLDGSGKSSSFIKLRFSCSWTKRNIY